MPYCATNFGPAGKEGALFICLRNKIGERELLELDNKQFLALKFKFPRFPDQKPDGACASSFDMAKNELKGTVIKPDKVNERLAKADRTAFCEAFVHVTAFGDPEWG